MNETTLNGQSMDVVADNIEKLKAIFPDVFSEGKVDFEKLEGVLGNYIDKDNDRYNFTWHGKSQALRLAQTPSTGTLRPCKKESKEWDTTQNLYIEGDNLEVLKLLQKSYHSKVKMVYIDPPYNTGNDFIYPDNYQDSIQNYLEITGQVDGEAKKLSTNTDASGRFHTNWLNMMYPRLRVARNLLSDDGVIFVSIDENEFANTKSMLNEIFGEENFMTAINVKLRHEDRILKGDKDFHEVVEYCLIYRKTNNYKQFKRKKDNTSLDEYIYTIKELEKPINKIMMGGKLVEEFSPEQYVIEKGNPSEAKLKRISIRGSLKEGNSSGRFYMAHLDSIKDKKGWLYKVPNMGNDMYPFRYFILPQNENIVNGTYFQGVPTDKKDVVEFPYPNFVDMVDIFNNVGYEGNVPFRNGKKPLKFLKHLFTLAGLSECKDALVLDFFSGSSTTAHALMQYNNEDNGNRKYIMVQIPEIVEEKEEAYKAGYKTICEIAKARIRNAGSEIENDNIDTGFRVLKLEGSNIKKWSPDYDNIEQTLYDHISNFVEERTEFDIVFEIMLKYGIDLTMPIEEYDLAGKKVFSIGFGALMICLDENIDLEIAHEITKLRDELQPEVCRVVFRDNGFKNDAIKTNVKENLKVNHFDEIVSI